MTLDQKVERLERENRLIKRLGIFFFTIVILGVAVSAERKRPTVVEATRFVLKSADGGRELGVWGLDDKNELCFRCNDDHGNARVNLSVFKARGDMKTFDTDVDKYGAMLSLIGASHDANGLILSDRHPRLTLVLKDDELPYLGIIETIHSTRLPNEPKSAEEPTADPSAASASHAKLSTISTMSDRPKYARTRLPFSN